MSKYNLELLRKVRAVINQEAIHNQGVWSATSIETLNRVVQNSNDDKPGGSAGLLQVSCPTAACVAGWAATLSGAKMLVDSSDYESARRFGQDFVTASACLTADGRTQAISDYGRELLGLDWVESSMLFSGENSHETVMEMLDELIVAADHDTTWNKVTDRFL